MKKISILVILCLGLVGCNKKEAIDYALFKGNVTGTATQVVITGNDFEKVIPITKEGVFSDTLKIDTLGYYDFYIGNESANFYLAKGFDLELNISLEKFDESIIYKGSGAEENNYLAQKFLKEEKFAEKAKELYSLPPQDFKNKILEIKQTNQKEIDGLLNAKAEFKEHETKDNLYSYLFKLSDYLGMHVYHTKEATVTLPDDFYKDLEGFNYFDENIYKSSSTYKDLTQRELRQKMGELKVKTQGDEYAAMTLLLNDLSPNGKIKEDFLLTQSYGMLSTSDMDKLYAILKTTPNVKHQKEYEARYNTLKKLKKGNPSPGFNYENYKGGTTSLNDLKGKYVYIDVWATWCAPCKKEIPFLKELEKTYHDKNISFVSISVDQKKDYDAWKTMVKEKELGGVQLFADNNWISEFVIAYGIKGIPRFILVDPEGNIADADAPRPSSPKLIETFTQLNI